MMHTLNIRLIEIKREEFKDHFQYDHLEMGRVATTEGIWPSDIACDSWGDLELEYVEKHLQRGELVDDLVFKLSKKQWEELAEKVKADIDAEDRFPDSEVEYVKHKIFELECFLSTADDEEDVLLLNVYAI